MPTKALTHKPHSTLYDKQYDERRGTSAERGYDIRWQRFRRSFLISHPVCDLCLQRGRAVGASEVHHLIPLRAGGERLDTNNCQALCKACHSRITAAGGGVIS